MSNNPRGRSANKPSPETLYAEATGSDKKNLQIRAEAAFALAVSYRRKAALCPSEQRIGLIVNARRYAQECVRILSLLRADTLEDIATIHTVLDGITMPNYFYLGYVTDRSHFPDFCALLD